MLQRASVSNYHIMCPCPLNQFLSYLIPPFKSISTSNIFISNFCIKSRKTSFTVFTLYHSHIKIFVQIITFLFHTVCSLCTDLYNNICWFSSLSHQHRCPTQLSCEVIITDAPHS
ncbi:hypothetical protein BsWGS_26397 [Bradybaena similaris]